jgi:hypothetical protein
MMPHQNLYLPYIHTFLEDVRSLGQHQSYQSYSQDGVEQFGLNKAIIN